MVESMVEPKELDVSNKILSDLPPCALIKFGQYVISGTYKLEEETGQRHGTLDVYSQDLALVISEPVSSAILDVRANGSIIYTAHSTGEVRLWALEEHKPVQTSLIQVDDDSLVLQIAVSENASQLSCSLSSGEIVLIDLHTQQEVWRSQSHTLEAWACVFDNVEQGIYSGGDDMLMCYHDLRTGTPTWKLRHHDAGVTSILPWKQCPNSLWTGGYDDNLRIVDPRFRRAKDSMNLGGGVWRLIPNRGEDQEIAGQQVLACCMYGGLRILTPQQNVESPYSLPLVSGTLTNHESMVYGGAWLDDGTGITCSFYDKLVQKWKI